VNRLARLCILLWLASLSPGCSTEPPPALLPLEELVPAQALEPVKAQIRAAWQAAKEAPADAAASGGLGMVLSAYAQSEQAGACYGRARILEPDDFRWPYYEAITLGDLGRTAEAISAMRNALVLQPGHPEAQLRLADWLVGTDPVQARALYEAVLSADPRRAEARLGLARLLMEQDEPQAAAAQLRAILELDSQIGEVHYALSRVLLQLGDRPGAEQHAALFRRFEDRRLHMQDPLVKAVTELNLSDKPHLTRADGFRKQGRLKEAAASLKWALAVNPGNPPARLDLMEVYAQDGRLEEAEAQYGAAAAALPQDPEPHLRWARLQRRGLDYPGAAESFSRALALQANRPDVLVEYGFVLEHAGQKDAALVSYRRALELKPENAGAHAGLGRLLSDGGDFAMAIPHLEHASQMPGPDRAHLLYRLALAYKGTGQRELARNALKAARPLATSGVDVRLAADIETALAALDENHQETQ
jgi:tetratricopeptide (TPR) repeat protein